MISTYDRVMRGKNGRQFSFGFENLVNDVFCIIEFSQPAGDLYLR